MFVASTSLLTEDRRDSYPYYYPIAFTLIVVFSVLICPRIIRLISNYELSHQSANNRTHLRLLASIIFYVLPFISLSVYFLAYYPGAFSLDSIRQYSQVITNQYNDWHPVIQTLLVFKLPLVISNGWIGSIVLFQIICLSAALGYAFNTIYKFTNIKYTIVSMAFILLNPQLGYTAMYPWKDVSFAIGAFLLLTYSLRVFLSKGCWMKKPLNAILFIIIATLTSLFRHNAILFTIPLVIAVIIYVTKKKGIIICLSILVLFLGIKYPMYSAIGVERPEKRQIEVLGMPMTIIGAVATYTPEALDDQTREFAYKVAAPEVWTEKYIMGDYNSVKFDARTNNDIIEEYGAANVIWMMIKSVGNSKYIATSAFVSLTEPTYSITALNGSFTLIYTSPNDLGISINKNAVLADICESYRAFATDYLSYPFLCLGLVHLALLTFVLAKCRLNSLSDWKVILYVAPVFSYNYGSTLLLTGAADAPRFFFYTFLVAPIVLLFLLLKGKTDSPN